MYENYNSGGCIMIVNHETTFLSPQARHPICRECCIEGVRFRISVSRQVGFADDEDLGSLDRYSLPRTTNLENLI
jgi:hypothetical protein